MSVLRQPPGSSKPLPKRTATPLTTDRIGNTLSPVSPDANTGGGGLFKSLLPKDGAGRLKIRSPTLGTPTADPRRLNLKSISARTPSASSATSTSIKLVTPRPLTGSDSDSSLADWTKVDETLQGMSEDFGETEAVLVTVRVRPPSDAELRTQGDSMVWDTPSWDDHLIKLPKGQGGGAQEREWVFDRILPPSSDNARAYATSARAHVKSAMEGYNALIFAYGQTASGKTFTLSGSPSNPGIIPLAISDLFAQIRRSPDREFLLRASYLELYNESIIDLLSPDGRELSLSEGRKKGEVVINGLTECAVRCEDDVRGLLRVGEENRKVGQTDWNARSSRSHCVFRITIESRAAGSVETPAKSKGAEKMTRISTLSIIDLAGSEKHTSSKERNVEGKHINQSLLTLKLVISKLADLASKRNVTHIPYRDSKLTRLLQPSLSGDSLISVICTLSPSSVNLSESLSTISFAQGLKRVVLRAQKKEVIDPQALIAQYQNEIAELKAMLREKEAAGGSSAEGRRSSRSGSGGNSSQRLMEKRLEELKSLILTSGNVGQGGSEARPLSPVKLQFPKLDFDKSTTELQENLHAAQIRIRAQQDEIAGLKLDLGARPINPDQRILELQDEVAGLKLIADDYERHLAEPTRKVREDVEKEYRAKMDRLSSALESKTIWANRLDENFRTVRAENKVLVEDGSAQPQRCTEAEAKVLQIMEWINAFLDPSAPLSSSPDASGSDKDIPTLVVSQDVPQDFGPAVGGSSGTANKQATLTLSAKVARGMSTMDLANFSAQFGTLTKSSMGRPVKMLREESGMDFARDMPDDEETF